MSSKVFITVVLAVVVGGALVGGLAGSIQEVSPVVVVDTGTELVKEPVWKPTPDRLDWRLSLESLGLGLKGSVSLEVDDRGHLLITDFALGQVYELSPRGELIRSYGEPGRDIQFGAVTDLDVSPSGELWISDNSARRLYVFGRDGQLERTLDLDIWPYRISTSRDGGFVVMNPVDSENLFSRFDASGRQLGSFANWVEDQSANGLALDGWLASDPRGGFVYASLYSGLLAAFDEHGGQRFLVNTEAELSLPDLRTDDHGAIAIDPDAEARALGLSLNGDEIHLLVVRRHGVRFRTTLEVHDLASGHYLYSRQLPRPSQSVVATPSRLYTVDSEGISSWYWPEDS